ncbi:hypothetical protein [Streptacidiphilus jiangxiensis]|uniref:Cytochrome P450 n=1 Tax=Streptacidiphilus jiangxiensis TaxID=235985 RepID=A0A1H7TRQ4_STRJI|nr:hypothetical protein [Streptacidiphilus jiangxiensis]SEL87199.1 hypothetical protein SAMN05414137_114154 [Streptacidiphilus jiangxiensis]
MTGGTGTTGVRGGRTPELPLRYPFEPGPLGTPPTVLQWARKHRPVCPVRLPSGRSVWMLTRHDDIARALSDPRLVPVEPDGHAPHLTDQGVSAQRPVIVRRTSRLLDAMAAGPNLIDLIPAYVGPLQEQWPDAADASPVSALAVGAFTLLVNPRAVRVCLADPSLWPKAVAEILRCHHAGVLGRPRIATEDLTLHGVTIRRGEAVCVPVRSAAGHDTAYRFDLHRHREDPTAATPEPGAALTRLLVGVALEALFTRLPGLLLAIAEREVPWDLDGPAARPVSLPVAWPTPG